MLLAQGKYNLAKLTEVKDNGIIQVCLYYQMRR